MTQDEIIEMAREAGWSGIYSSWTSPTNRTSLTVPVTMQQLEAFAKLVAAKEREACVKIVQTHLDANDDLRTKDSLASVLDYIKFIR